MFASVQEKLYTKHEVLSTMIYKIWRPYALLDYHHNMQNNGVTMVWCCFMSMNTKVCS